MIVVQLLGGMGNQMFQYALGRRLALLNNTALKLDTSILLDWSPGRHSLNRDYDLNIFNIEGAVASPHDIAPYNSQLMNVLNKLLFKIKQKLFGSKITRERFFHFDENILKLTGNLYLAGTWQSYKYFEPIADIIRKDFSFKEMPSTKTLLLKDQINSNISVCLNVRRTDYITVKSTSDILSFTGIDYYRKALEAMEERIGNFNVFVFSDDIQWCRENLGFIQQPVTYVDYEYAGKKFSEYLYLMSSCHHFIIPNSTFAWWGAWLSSSSNEKIVITPRKWLNDPTINTADLIPDNWLKL